MCIYLLQCQPRGHIVFEEAGDRNRFLFVKLNKTHTVLLLEY